MYDSMFQTESYHWWFRGKREIVEELAKKLFADLDNPSPRTIDFGCGCGLMLNTLKKYAEVTGADFSQQALDYCREGFDGQLQQIDLSCPTHLREIYDVGIALDILEHIPNDAIAATNLYTALKPGGRCILTVPAHQWLWSAHDDNCMHKRRYHSASFQLLLEAAGFSIEYLSYYNCFLFPAAVIVRLATKLLGKDNDSNIENNFSDGFVNRCLYTVFSLEKPFLLKKKRLPFGLSLIAVVSKPT